MVLLTELVEASARVAETRSRREKIAALSTVLGRLGDDEVSAGTAFLSGEIPGGRVGVGWATLAGLDVPSAAESALTVAEVAGTFDRIRRVTGAGATRRRARELGQLLRLATAAEQDFVYRLIGGELRQGALEGVMLEAIASAAEVPPAAVRRAFMLSGRLPATAEAALRGGAAELARFRLEVGRPVRPMLASPGQDLDSALAELGSVVVEYKLDGARIQVHRRGEDVRVFTRTLRDITATVPELVALTRGLDCQAVVLDGETLALSDSGRPRPFQETMGRFGAGDPRALLLHPYFFDCLHLDGADLIDLPLRERLTALARVAPEHRVPSAARPAPERAWELFDASLDAGHEGVMVKSLDSPYTAGRRGSDWRKIKPAHTLDLVVLAAEWGHGRRRGHLSNLHLGARDPDGGPPIMVGKTFKGLTDELLQWQSRELLRSETHRDSWTVYLAPDWVVEIELDGVQRSTRYPGGVALRFARVLRYRSEKDAATADTIDSVREMLPRHAG